MFYQDQFHIWHHLPGNDHHQNILNAKKCTNGHIEINLHLNILNYSNALFWPLILYGAKYNACMATSPYLASVECNNFYIVKEAAST